MMQPPALWWRALPTAWSWTEALCLLNTFFVVGNVLQYAWFDTQARYGRFTSAADAGRPERKSSEAARAPPPPSPSWPSPLQRLVDDFNALPWNHPVPARVAWFLMEVPNLLCTVVVLTCATPWDELEDAPLRQRAAVALFVFHYVVRTFVYSMLIKGGKPMPLDTFLAGAVFTTVNGLVQTYHHTRPVGGAYWRHRDAAWDACAQLLGLSLFALGFVMNQLSDRTLRNLRRNDEDRGYYVPHGFFFKHLSAPNLVG